MVQNIRARSIRILKTCTLGRPGDTLGPNKVIGVTENYLRRYLAQQVLEFIDIEPEPNVERRIDVEVEQQQPEQDPKRFEGLAIEVTDGRTEAPMVRKARKLQQARNTRDTEEG